MFLGPFLNGERLLTLFEVLIYGSFAKKFNNFAKPRSP